MLSQREKRGIRLSQSVSQGDSIGERRKGERKKENDRFTTTQSNPKHFEQKNTIHATNF